MSYVVSAIVKTDFMDLKNETYAHRKKNTNGFKQKFHRHFFQESQSRIYDWKSKQICQVECNLQHLK